YLYRLRFDASRDGLLLAHQHTGGFPLHITNRLQSPTAGKRERNALWLGQQFLYFHFRPGGFTLHPLLPRVKRAITDPQRLDRAKLRFRLPRPVGQRRYDLAGCALRQVQKADDRLDHRRCVALHQTFRLIARSFAVAGLTVRFGKESAESPALPIFDRWTIGIENVSLIENSVCNAVNEQAIHVLTGSSAARRRSI